MKAPKIESNFEPLAAGNYMARLYQIIYIGTVPVEWQGQQKWQYKVRFTFEFPTEKKVFKEENGEQPFVLSTEFTLSMQPKSKLRPMVESWLGKKMNDDEANDFDIDELLGKEALVNVVHKQSNDGNTYANIAAISPLMKGSTCPDPINPPIIFGYENWDENFFQNLPEFLRKKIMTSKEYGLIIKTPENGVQSQPAASDEEIDIDEIPF